MDINELEFWLKNTIPGIIILGAFGSIIGALLLWLITKIGKYLLKILSIIIDKTFGDSFYKIVFLYMKHYFIFRGTLLQLNNRNKKIELAVMYQGFINNRNLMIMLSSIFFISTYFLFLFTGITYTKTAIFFNAITITFIHDAIIYTVAVNKIYKIMLGAEKEFSKQTYSQEDVLFMEVTSTLKNFKSK